MRSIRRYLSISLVSVVGLGMLLILVVTYLIVSHEVEERFDAQMSQTARVVWAMVGSSVSDGGLRNLDQAVLESLSRPDDRRSRNDNRYGHHYETKLAFQLIDAEGQIAFRTSSAPRALLAPLAIGYSVQLHDSDSWRVFQLHDEQSDHWVLVGERTDVRGEIVEEMAKLAVAANVFGLPVVIVLIWLVLRRGLAPLMRIADEIGGRAPDHLDPLPTRGLPDELSSTVAALNRLLGQLDSALVRERRFTADAAHELRTPLAVLKLHAQNACEASSDTARDQSLAQLTRGVDRASHLVAQMLTLARLEPTGDEQHHQALDLARLVREEGAQLAALALRKSQTLSLDGAEQSIFVFGDELGLSVLFRNLLDNAIRYTPEGGSVEVRLARHAHEVMLSVCDSGPGVSAEMRERVFDRFFQQAPGKGQGAGLGLSIVRRIAELHGAQIGLAPGDSGGLCITLLFPDGEASRS